MKYILIIENDDCKLIRTDSNNDLLTGLTRVQKTKSGLIRKDKADFNLIESFVYGHVLECHEPYKKKDKIAEICNNLFD